MCQSNAHSSTFHATICIQPLSPFPNVFLCKLKMFLHLKFVIYQFENIPKDLTANNISKDPMCFWKFMPGVIEVKSILESLLLVSVAYSQFATCFVKVMFLRAWSQRSWLTKSLVTEVLAQLRTQSSNRVTEVLS